MHVTLIATKPCYRTAKKQIQSTRLRTQLLQIVWQLYYVSQTSLHVSWWHYGISCNHAFDCLIAIHNKREGTLKEIKHLLKRNVPTSGLLATL